MGKIDRDTLLRLAAQDGDDYLREVLAHDEIGQDSGRSLHYWHYRLGLAAPGQVPAQPRRRIAAWSDHSSRTSASPSHLPNSNP